MDQLFYPYKYFPAEKYCSVPVTVPYWVMLQSFLMAVWVYKGKEGIKVKVVVILNNVVYSVSVPAWS